MRVEERDGVSNLNGVVGRGDATDQDTVDGGGGVFERVKDELDVSVLCNLVPQIAAHDGFTTHSTHTESEKER